MIDEPASDDFDVVGALRAILEGRGGPRRLFVALQRVKKEPWGERGPVADLLIEILSEYFYYQTAEEFRRNWDLIHGWIAGNAVLYQPGLINRLAEAIKRAKKAERAAEARPAAREGGSGTTAEPGGKLKPPKPPAGMVRIDDINSLDPAPKALSRTSVWRKRKGRGLNYFRDLGAWYGPQRTVEDLKKNTRSKM
ncbi:MAG: hypothetical protein HY717_03445 [Planctomycetes bacterium]|nr:hypothetical protein [Planctomycetota bacterium]